MNYATAFLSAVIFGCFTLLILMLAGYAVGSVLAIKLIALASVCGYLVQVMAALEVEDVFPPGWITPMHVFSLVLWGMALSFGAGAIVAIMFV